MRYQDHRLVQRLDLPAGVDIEIKIQNASAFYTSRVTGRTRRVGWSHKRIDVRQGPCSPELLGTGRRNREIAPSRSVLWSVRVKGPAAAT